MRDNHPANLKEACFRNTDRVDYPHCQSVDSQIVIYDAVQVRLEIDKGGQSISAEWANCLLDGPGVLVVRDACAHTVVDRSTEVLRKIVAEEKANGKSPADHFGNNERIWNAMQKACLAAPNLFTEYYGNPILHLASRSWLGPGYQITAQMNNVRPGGTEQTPHRDYHLGFQSPQTVRDFPLHAQVMSQHLTLQGAIAHTDMTIEHGPTLFLPYSQRLPTGYQFSESEELIDFFRERKVQLPLNKGDMVFFNPAVFHAGGSNSTQDDRIANLVQISSAFGRTMESLDRQAMIAAVYPELLRLQSASPDSPTITNVIATVASGYAFPTNLDSDPPINGNAPKTQQAFVSEALNNRTSLEDLQAILNDYERSRTP